MPWQGNHVILARVPLVERFVKPCDDFLSNPNRHEKLHAASLGDDMVPMRFILGRLGNKVSKTFSHNTRSTRKGPSAAISGPANIAVNNMGWLAAEKSS